MRPTKHQSTYSTRPQRLRLQLRLELALGLRLALRLRLHASPRWPSNCLQIIHHCAMSDPSGPKRVSTPFHRQTNNFTRFIFHINDFSAVYCLLYLSFYLSLTLSLSLSVSATIHCFTNCPLTRNYASLTQRLMGAVPRLFALC